jgi:hypothetical protein
MKLPAIIVALILCILLLDKFQSKLPPPFPQIHAVWMKFSHILGGIMSWIILAILWVTVFGPYALIYKLTNKKQNIDSTAKTYWIDVKEESNLKYQF